MDNKKYTITLLFIAFCAIFFIWHKNKKTAPAELSSTLIIGTSPDYPPYSFIDAKTNQVVGFDIDVATEIAQRMDKKYSILSMPFDSLIFGLITESIDIIAAGITPTDAKRKTVTFSDPYLEGDPLVVLYRNEIEITSLDDLIQYSVVVNNGYTAEAFLHNIPNIQLTKLKSPAEALMALQTGSVDAFVCAKSTLHTMLKKSKMTDFKQFEIPETGDSYAITMSKHKKDLIKNVANALQSMKKDGTLHMLQKKWGLE